ncbi:transcription factor bHLH35-like isoform X1 [Magnolia sinica]|uniref:transcription factor bHLH35-like isoform X1 n=1 Tax=Magnolia sinica TaxID=86752 RepID=UPI0026591F4E|nr:transcription factor bHLH35-like isoform X1 [Magnolia sinica]
MEFEQMSFCSPESDDLVDDLHPLSGIPPAIFSPAEIQYGSMLESMEMELMLPDVMGGESSVGEEIGRAVGVNNEEDEGILGNGGCKNLLSERNRRKRLNQQLLSLRSLVPWMSKMDKRSVLIDATAYLRSLHEEMDQIKRELSAQEASESSTITSSESPLPSPDEIQQPHQSSSTHHQIIQIEAEELGDRTYTVKVVFKKTPGAVGQVHRMLESLGHDISQSWTHIIDEHQMVTTSFLRVKKQANLTPDALKAHISKAAFKLGIEVEGDDYHSPNG